MIIVEAWAEPSGINDNETSKPIFVTTSARITFRRAFPKAQKIRNNILNTAIATIFSASKTTQKFKPKSKHKNYIPGTLGMVRNAGGGRFIAIHNNEFVKIIEFKGSPPQLTFPEVAAPGAGGGQSGSDPSIPSPSADTRGPSGSAADDLLGAISG